MKGYEMLGQLIIDVTGEGASLDSFIENPLYFFSF
jgi:hypothetical protein